MAKWEYLKVSAWFSGGAQGIIIRLTPKRESHAKFLAAVGLKAVETDPLEHERRGPAYDTMISAPWESCHEKFYALIDAVTADGWEPFDVHEEHLVRVMHLRRQTG